MDEQYFYNNFNTQLSPEQEQSFQNWAQQNNRLNDLYDYDLRGFYKAGEEFGDNGHGVDIYKKPNHPTFSDQSMYSGTPAPWGGNYVGGTWEETPKGVSYTPSYEMLTQTHPLGFLQDYMAKYEPDVTLNMDRKAKLADMLRKR